MNETTPINETYNEDKLFRVKAGAFLTAVAGISSLFGFGATIAVVKKKDPQYFSKGVAITAEMADSGAILALRALGWGSFYAITGTSLMCYGIWKLSGASDLKDFGVRMGQILPRIPKNDPPQSRTEFSGINDLLNYVSNEWGNEIKESKP